MYVCMHVYECLINAGIKVPHPTSSATLSPKQWYSKCMYVCYTYVCMYFKYLCMHYDRTHGSDVQSLGFMVRNV